jgi:hypothetical protein
VTSAILDAPSRDLGRPQLALVLLVALPVLVMFALGICVAFGVRGNDITIAALALVTGTIALVPLILDVGRPGSRRELLLTFTCLSFMANFSVSVFTTYFLGTSVSQVQDLGFLDLRALRPSDIINGQIAALVGLLLLLLGYWLPIGRLFRGSVLVPRRDWTYQAAMMVATLMIPLGWALYFASTFGVLPARAGSGLLGTISNSTYVGLALLMLVYLRHGSRLAWWMMVLLIPPSMALNFLGGSKTALLSPPAVVAVAYIVVKRRIAIRWVLIALAAVIVIYPVAEFQRRVILRENTKGAAYALSRPVDTVSRIARFIGSSEFGDYLMKGSQATSRRSDGLGVLSVILRDCPSRVPYQGGWTIGYIALSYVPRLVWADKPAMTTGQWVTDNFAGGPAIRSNTAPTWLGELYFNFGWPGLVIGMLFMGVFMRALHEMLFASNATLPTRILAIVVLFAFPQSLPAALIGAVNAAFFAAIPLAFAHWAVRLVGGAPLTAAARGPDPGFTTNAPVGA